MRTGFYQTVASDALTYDVLADAATALAVARHDVELDLVGTVLPDPTRGVPVAESAGVDQHVFDRDDARILWLAAKLGAGRPQGMIYNVARDALKWFHLWDDSQIAGNFGSMRWSDASLQVLFNGRFHCPPIIERFAHRLLSIDRRQREASGAYRRCLSSLESDEDVPAARPRRRVQPKFILTAPQRKRGAA